MNILSIMNHPTFTWLRNISPSRKSLCVSLIVLPVFVVIANHYFHEFTLVQYDDSYITYRYARNFALGDGLRFNPGDNTNSASSLLFVLLLGIGNLITRAPIELIATTINTLSLLVLGLLVCICTRFIDSQLWSTRILDFVWHGDDLLHGSLGSVNSHVLLSLRESSLVSNHMVISDSWTFGNNSCGGRGVWSRPRNIGCSPQR